MQRNVYTYGLGLPIPVITDRQAGNGAVQACLDAQSHGGHTDCQGEKERQREMREKGWKRKESERDKGGKKTEQEKVKMCVCVWVCVCAWVSSAMPRGE